MAVRSWGRYLRPGTVAGRQVYNDIKPEIDEDGVRE